MRVYIDTSVIGGCLDEEFKEWSLRYGMIDIRSPREVLHEQDL